MADVVKDKKGEIREDFKRKISDGNHTFDGDDNSGNLE